jgi:zinc transporter ZupT
VASAVPVGAVVSNWFVTHAGNGVLDASLAFSAGMFLHIAATDLAPEIHHARKNRASHVAAFLIGVAVMAVVALTENPNGG